MIIPALHHTRPPYIQIDWVGMFTAAAGSCIYNGGAWPDRFNGTHFLSEPTVNLVHNDWLKPDGVTYIAGKEPGREEAEFIAGTDLWFRDRKSTRLNSSHQIISYAVFCLKKKIKQETTN